MTYNGLNLIFSFTFHLNWWGSLMQTIIKKFLQDIDIEYRINLS